MDVAPQSPPLHPRTEPALGCRLLANSHYATWLTTSGSGFSTSNGTLLTSWRADAVEDGDGVAIYLRDLDRGDVWSAGAQEPLAVSEPYAIDYRPGLLAITRTREDIETRLEVWVPPGRAWEFRRLIVSNRSPVRRRIEVTSHAEVVLNDRIAHAAHPAFSKLFVQTAFDPKRQALLVTRRSRAPGDCAPTLFHGSIDGTVTEYETDRASFWGRAPGKPRALSSPTPLSRTVGNVLDPVVSLRQTLLLQPHESKTCTFVLGVAPDSDQARASLDAASRPGFAESSLRAAEGAERALLADLDVSAADAEYFQALAGAVLFGHPQLPGRAGQPSASRSPADSHAGMGLVVVEPDATGKALASLLRYWQRRDVPIDVVLFGPRDRPMHVDPDHSRIRNRDDLSEPQRAWLRAGAQLVISDDLPELDRMEAFAPIDLRHVEDATPHAPVTAPPVDGALFANGYGAFARSGSEYVIDLPRQSDGRLRLPPRPWVNVIANPDFGFVVSETGAGATWRGNSRINCLTPWFNDPVRDPHGEAFYVRDSDSGAYWSPLPGPAPGAGTYQIRHGLGYSVGHHHHADLTESTTVFVPPSDTVKIVTVHIRNQGQHRRRLSVFAYHRLVLGLRPDEHGAISVDRGEDSSSMFATNLRGEDFAAGAAFAAVVAPHSVRAIHCTGNRREFIGRGGSPERPGALGSTDPLRGRTGSDIDPCFAFQVDLELAPDTDVEIHFLLGQEDDRDRARSTISRYREPDAISAALADAQQFWRAGVSGIKIRTPTPELDCLVNHWLPYQTLSCRIWGRSALYQAGGAFGFRDQLQDAGALIYLWPELTREQILRHAAHQFIEGDVLHWWHPPRDLGTRTRFADDLLWLPFMTAFYVRTTGDSDVLEESVPFVTARALEPGEDEALVWPERSPQSTDVYEHCCLAMERALVVGDRDLPLFGTGDWNDGMNRVGREGRGQSVWMGFFLYTVLGDFVPLCRARGDEDRVRRFTEHREQLRSAVNDAGWDGQWYRRGFYDDGEILGSKQNRECRIDALAQAWAVLSGAAPPERAREAMDAVEAHLISDPDGVIRLLTPPFEHTTNDPGYIKGYVPGVRENGGQYTHAALWVVRAMAELGRHDRAGELLALINPIAHTRSPGDVRTYQVEPYVVAADVYGAPPHVGRGGWTWYTGSAGWMYRVALESILGFEIRDGREILLSPRTPAAWREFEIAYRVPGEETTIEITIVNPSGRSHRGVVELHTDIPGAAVSNGRARIPICRDGKRHRVRAKLGSRDDVIPR